MREDRELPLEDGEAILVEMANAPLDDVLACIAQQIFWRVNGFDQSLLHQPDDVQAKYNDAAMMAYKMAYNAQLPETPEYLEWKASQSE